MTFCEIFKTMSMDKEKVGSIPGGWVPGGAVPGGASVSGGCSVTTGFSVTAGFPVNGGRVTGADKCVSKDFNTCSLHCIAVKTLNELIIKTM